jgi:hypothetical protein
MRASLPYTNPKYVALLEKTVFLGLHIRAGLFDPTIAAHQGRPLAEYQIV